MKKFITLALALVMALAFAAPAMAFVAGGNETSASPYELSIRLVEFSNNGFYQVSFAAPAANSGYVQNQVVCGIASVYIPKGRKLGEDYARLRFTGDNLKFNTVDVAPITNLVGVTAVTENNSNRVTSYLSGTTASNALTNAAADNNFTFQVAAFARITADDAVMKVSLAKGTSIYVQGQYTTEFINDANATNVNLMDSSFYRKVNGYRVIGNTGGARFLASSAGVGATDSDPSTAPTNASAATLLRVNSPHIGTTVPSQAGYTFYYDHKRSGTGMDTTFDGPYQPLFAITTNAKTSNNLQTDWNSQEMFIYEAVQGTPYYNIFRVVQSGSTVDFVGPDDRLVSVGSGQYASGYHSSYNYLKNVYDTVIVGKFGMDIALVGNAVKPGYFNDTLSVDDLSDEVVIEPWYPYVEVPEEIIIDPPKTGDALNIMGFVLVALAGLAVVAVKKVRA